MSFTMQEYTSLFQIFKLLLLLDILDGNDIYAMTDLAALKKSSSATQTFLKSFFFFFCNGKTRISGGISNEIAKSLKAS